MLAPALVASTPIMTAGATSGRTSAVVTVSRPPSVNSQPASRCVCRYVVSLICVPGVRTPTNQFDFTFGR